MNAACRAIRPLLSAYMDNEVTPDELRAIGAHIATCAECAAVLAEYRALRALVRALPQPLPPGNLQGAVFARATPTYRRRAAWFEFAQRGLAIGALAVAIIAIVLTGSLVMRQSAVGRGFAALDRTPPVVTAWDPTPGNANSRPNQPVRITFSEPMDEDSVLAALRFELPPGDNAERERLLAGARWDGTTLILGDGGSLQPDTDYTIDIDPNVARDTAGNSLRALPQKYSFRTTDVIALASSVAPSPVVAPTATAEPTTQLTPTKDPGGTLPIVQPTKPLVPTATTVPRPTSTATAAPVIAQPPPTQAQTVVNGPAPIPTATPVPPAAAPEPTEQPAPQPIVAPTTTAQPTPQPTQAATPASTQAPTVTATTSPTVAPTAATPVATATAAPPSPTVTPKLPFEVVGGFGQIYTRNGPVRDRIGLPTAPETKVGGTYQLFEGGLMFWREDTATIYVLFAGEPGIWYAFADGWMPGMEPGGGAGPAAGQFKPQRGFGKVWREQSEVQKRLGYALSADEIGTTLVIQPFEHGPMVWTTASGKPMISVLYENNTYERYEDVSK